MIPIVIDASVAAKWVLAKEPLASQAAELLDGYGKGEIAFAVPDLFWAEISNTVEVWALEATEVPTGGDRLEGTVGRATSNWRRAPRRSLPAQSSLFH